MVPTATDTDELRRLCEVAAQLVDDSGSLSERDRQSFNAGVRWSSRAIFDHGIDVGRAQAINEITEEQGRTARRIAGLALEPDWSELERIRLEPVRTRYCVGPDCRTVETVPMDTDMTTVRCYKHRRTGEPPYLRDPDYRPYAGGPVPAW